MNKKDPLWIGIARHGAGWRATVTQGRDKPRIQQHFLKDTDPRDMQEWRADTKAKLRLTRKQRATMGTFAGDAKRYLQAVTALTTYKERKRDIELWIEIFRTVDRSRITSADIRAQRDKWLTEPRDGKKAPPLSASTVNHRLRALSNLFTVLDGGLMPNPVRKVPEATEPTPEPRALDYPTIEKILKALPDLGLAKKGKKRPKISLTKIRLTCLAYSPLTPKQLGMLTPNDLDLIRGRIRLPARQKGKGADAIWLPLLPEAKAAFDVFHAERAYGSFSVSQAGKSFRNAAKKAGVTGARIYDLRHSFATMAYHALGSLDAVGVLLQHRSRSTTRRYALGAEYDVLTATMDRVGTHLKGSSVAPPNGTTE